MSVVGKETLKALCDQTMREIKQAEDDRAMRLAQGGATGGISDITGDPCDDKIAQQDVQVNLDIYEAIGVTDMMCSSNCPC